MRKVLRYLNPIAHFGDKNYSVFFPLITTLLTAVILEGIFVWLLHTPNAVGLYAIFVFIVLIVYFAFREGIRGGMIAALLTIFYYLYIISSRNYTGNLLVSSLQTTATLGLLYGILAWVIGWLKQTIDSLLEREANAKKRLQMIIQQLPVGVLITDDTGEITEGNKQVELILGRKMKSGRVAGKDTIPEATYKDKPVPPSQWPLAQTLTTGKPVAGKEFILTRDDGKKRYVQISASLITNKTGNIVAAASIMTDITAQKELEERKDDFVNMASHELKTPITSMKLYTESLRSRLKHLDDRDVQKMITGIKTQTERLQSLVNDLLDVSRLQTGKLMFTPESFNLNSVIKQTITELKGTAKNHTINFNPTGSITLTADKFRIYQVLTNLITNAIKYSPPGSKITIRVKKDRKSVTVSVKDSGIGISKDQQKKVFDRLYQVTDSKEKTFPGLGMGLYISREIIRHHKGTIWVESEPSKGSTFYFTLPLN